MHRAPLFRPEAVAAARSSPYGTVVLAQPASLGVLIGAACSAAACLIALFAWGSYTRHTTLSGALVPHSGLIEVRAPQYGTIVESFALEGGAVAAGETLYVLSGERVSSARGATFDAVSAQLGLARRSIETQIAQTRQLETTERLALGERIEALDVELARLQTSMADQRVRIAAAEDAVERYRSIESEGFVSREQLIAREEAASEQRARLHTLEREGARVEREAADARTALATLARSYANRIAELERAAVNAELEITENEAVRRALVVAPRSGTATAVTGRVGQTVEAGALLAAIVPDGARLQAHLYAPSAAVGFIRRGDEVLLRYAAYPYQKFGHQRGRVESLSRAAVPSASRGPPLYRVVVTLERQTIDAQGESRPLPSGMLVEADVLQDTRRLYEWVLEPLLSVSRGTR